MSAGAPKKVLVIDDEEDIREVIQMSLEGLTSWKVITAANGVEGISKAESEKPDAILLDVMMPGIDGPETLSRLKSKTSTKNIPIVLLTAKVMPSDVKELGHLEVATIVSKPFDPMTLHDLISRGLGW
jgi:two-component system alkaline phosphatase synthesis response regulator PhoP